ncbi:MAG: hypothetical protein NTZ10_04795 [Candidatus Saganbacteria bacterium]|nr:hypothetical protein [Candidatus Saganbacteria bacterium]
MNNMTKLSGSILHGVAINNRLVTPSNVLLNSCRQLSKMGHRKEV